MEYDKNILALKEEIRRCHSQIPPWHNYAMAQLRHGTITPWHNYAMAQLRHGTITPWHRYVKP